MGKFTHFYLSSNIHFVPCLESESDVVLGVNSGMVEQRRPKLLIKFSAESIPPLQPSNELHINLPLSLPAHNLPGHLFVSIFCRFVLNKQVILPFLVFPLIHSGCFVLCRNPLSVIVAAELTSELFILQFCGITSTKMCI